MKKPTEFKTSIIQLHSKLNREGTNNTVFYQAIMAPINDKKFNFNNELKQSLELPKNINNFYQQKVDFGVYERLFDLVIISLCSDIEFLFKDLFSRLTPSKKYKFGFYQRINDVLEELANLNFNFSNCTQEIENLKLVFQIRHICTHNMGYIDEDFINKTNYTAGTKFIVNTKQYNLINKSYYTFLECLDNNISKLNEETA